MTDLTKDSEALDKAWYELEADALASDGRITDRDVKDAIKRNRARIEAAVRSDTLADVAAAMDWERLLSEHHDERWEQGSNHHCSAHCADRFRALARLTGGTDR